ncbi:MotB family protein [Rhizobium sp. 2YAF20]|uniref:MotB family protein n=1 Tax=Rhizobium sp. 2YAF20 TaxID=3233027 RepID=UPI003F97563B
MSDSENHHHGKNEIIIIKRHGGGDHEGGHGGAWKIAYADFMTAMMAFFLVMWLVNAANEETKASVASYFNPIKLADEKPTEKGLKKPVDQADGEQNHEKSKQKEEQQTNGTSAKTGDDQTATAGDQTNYSEADFFENPYSVLAEIAQEVGQQANVSAKGDGGASTSGPATGADGGEAYRDPFDPDFWTKQVQVSSASKKQGKEDSKSETASKGEVVAMAKATAADTGEVTDQPQTPEDQATVSDQQSPTKPPVPGQKKQPGQQPTASDQANADETTADQKAGSTKTADNKPDAQKPATKDQEKQAKDLQQAITQQISGVAGQLAEGLVVTPSEGGLLVTISDQGNDPMFNVGSAVPRKEMVLAMEKIGKILSDRKGAIVIRGHTDGRQFKGTQKDNWRLSLDRAESAYYMLLHGGLDEKRISQVSGFADRRLKLPDDPLNDANRRIEILVQGTQG